MSVEMLNKVILGDCLEVMKEIPQASVDMVLCDLPYGVTQNTWDQVIDIPALWTQYRRIVKPEGVIALFGQGAFTGALISSNPEMFKYKIVWIKSTATNFLNANRQPLRRHEDICIFYKDQPQFSPQKSPGRSYSKGYRTDNKSGNYGFTGQKIPIRNLSRRRYPSDVQFYAEEHHPDYLFAHSAAHNKEGYFHPTQKPIPLARYLIRSYSRPGDMILDNACGSGTFLAASILEFRNFIGIEKNQICQYRGKPVDQIAICHQRLAQALRQRSRLFNQ